MSSFRISDICSSQFDAEFKKLIKQPGAGTDVGEEDEVDEDEVRRETDARQAVEDSVRRAIAERKAVVLSGQDLYHYGRHRLSASNAHLHETGFIRYALMGKQWMDTDNLTKVWSRSHFACWQLNRSIYQQASPGLNFALAFELHTHSQDIPMYASAWKMQAGLLVSIHNEQDTFFDEDSAFLVAAGTRHDVQIIRTSAKRLQYPYGTSCVDNADSVSRCIRQCEQILTAQNECKAPDDLETAEKIVKGAISCEFYTSASGNNFRDYSLEQIANGTMCVFPPEQPGASDVAAQRMRFRAPLYAFCPLPCEEFMYEIVSRDVSSWPPSSIPGLRALYAHQEGLGKSEAADAAMVRIFFGNFVERTYEESVKVEIASMIGNVGKPALAPCTHPLLNVTLPHCSTDIATGGNLGLALGMSIMTVVEWLEYVLACVTNSIRTCTVGGHKIDGRGP
jgi:hypothetical protein